MDASTTPPFSLDRPLPAELAGRTHGWFTRYRSHPVFSRDWGIGRTRVLLLLLGPAYLFAAVPALFARPSAPIGALAQLAVQIFVPLAIGPWLGLQVRRRGLPERQEGRALAAAMVLLVLLMLAFHQWAAEPMKQWLAESTGMLDGSGKRKPLVLAIGISVVNPDQAAEPPAATALAAANRAVHVTLSALITFLLGGGAALLGWRRERDGLRAVVREQELVRAQAERREAELRLSVLAAQVEPHFLFNTLAGVRSAIATDPSRASEMIDRLVEYLRAAIPRLRGSGSAQASVGAQLDIVRAYLALMASRMPRLKVTIDAPQDLLAARCPPLMLISLAENAVKHGVERKVGPASIEVRAARDASGDLQVSVVDDGAGFAEAGLGGGLGLANIRERLAQLYPGRATLVLKARPEGGVAAIITLPLEPADSP